MPTSTRSDLDPIPEGLDHSSLSPGATSARRRVWLQRRWAPQCPVSHNTVEPCYFAVESPHENERGFEIDHNLLHGAVSVPKGGQGADPTKEGFDYAVEIHHNIMTDSYAVEGPRNHLRVHHNYIRIGKPNGRVYAQFGGENNGPVRFDHNIIENVDRSLLWIRTGRAANVTFEANTVFAADVVDRSGILFSAWEGEDIYDWVIRDNVIVAAWSRPRQLLRMERGVMGKMSVTGNLLVNVTHAPKGNLIDVWPNFARGDQERPWGYYTPIDKSGPTVDAGQRPAETFIGDGPDIGAVEFGAVTEPVGPRQ